MNRMIIIAMNLNCCRMGEGSIVYGIGNGNAMHSVVKY